MTGPLRAAAIGTALVGVLSFASPPAAEAAHGRSRSYSGYGRGHGYRYSRSYRSYRPYRPAIVVAPAYRYYYSAPVYDPYYYAAPYYSPYDGYRSGYRYAPYRPAYGYGYRHFHGGVLCRLRHLSIGIGW
jgi:hypothetical protein